MAAENPPLGTEREQWVAAQEGHPTLVVSQELLTVHHLLQQVLAVVAMGQDR